MKYLLIFIIALPAFTQKEVLSETLQNDFRDLVSETNDWRNSSIDFLTELATNSKKVITSEELSRIHNKGTLKYKSLREQYYAIINKVKYIADVQSKNTTFIENKKTGFSGGMNWLQSLIVNDGNFFLVADDYIKSEPECLNFDLCTSEGRDLALNFKLALASALILYDNYALVVTHLNKVDKKAKLDKIINKDNSEISDFLKGIEQEYSSISNYKAMANAVKIYERMSQKLSNQGDLLSDFERFVDGTITSSYVYSKKDEISEQTVWHLRRDFAKKWLKTHLSSEKDEFTNGLSKIFGNTVGLVETRKGKLLYQNPNDLNQLMRSLENTLQPMDVLLEKTPFRLTDKFIPGHWGHVAIWLGTEQQLREKKLWATLPQSVQESVKSGKNILEALRPGVQINSLQHFLNIDDLAIIRPNFIKTDKDLAYYMQRSIEQVGKEYDFNFDVETEKKIVCSEIAYVIFNKAELKWPLDKTLGRYTISPDHVALKSTKEAIKKSSFSFTPIKLYHDGKLINESQTEVVFEKLLNQDYTDI